MASGGDKYNGAGPFYNWGVVAVCCQHQPARPIVEKLRSFMRQNPMAGWTVAAVLMLFAAAAMLYISESSRRSEAAQLTGAGVTIRDTETGDNGCPARGVMEKELWLRPYPVNASDGLAEPKDRQKHRHSPSMRGSRRLMTINKQHAEASRGENWPKVRACPGAAPPATSGR